MARVSFHDVDFMPAIPVRLTHSKKKLRKFYRDFGEDPECLEESFGKSYAITNTFTRGGECLHVVYMTDCLDHAAEEDAGLLAHEAVHVVEEYFRNIGEYVQSDELRAYAVQGVTTYLVGEHFKWKQKRFDKRR